MLYGRLIFEDREYVNHVKIHVALENNANSISVASIHFCVNLRRSHFKSKDDLPTESLPELP